MLNCKMAAIPINLSEKLQFKDGIEKANASFFRSLIGALIYLTHTRPYIVFSVGVVSRFMHSLAKHHLGAPKRVLLYIARTIDGGIWYSNMSNFKLNGFTDSD